jgi:hypothetical protein
MFEKMEQNETVEVLFAAAAADKAGGEWIAKYIQLFDEGWLTLYSEILEGAEPVYLVKVNLPKVLIGEKELDAAPLLYAVSSASRILYFLGGKGINVGTDGWDTLLERLGLEKGSEGAIALSQKVVSFAVAAIDGTLKILVDAQKEA